MSRSLKKWKRQVEAALPLIDQIDDYLDRIEQKKQQEPKVGENNG